MTHTPVDIDSLHEGSHKTFLSIFRETQRTSAIKRIGKKFHKELRYNPELLADPTSVFYITCHSLTERAVFSSLGFSIEGRATSLMNARQNAFDMSAPAREVDKMLKESLTS